VIVVWLKLPSASGFRKLATCISWAALNGIKGGQILFTVYSLNAVEMHKQVNLYYIHAMIYSILEVRYLS